MLEHTYSLNSKDEQENLFGLGELDNMHNKMIIYVFTILTILCLLIGCIEITPRFQDESTGDTSQQGEDESNDDSEQEEEPEEEDGEEVEELTEEEQYNLEYYEEGVMSVDELVMNKDTYLGKQVTIKTPKIRTYDYYKSVILSDKYGSRELKFDIPQDIDISIFPIHEAEECMYEGCLMWASSRNR